MDFARARALLIAERDEVRDLLKRTEDAVRQDHEAETGNGPGDAGDLALPVTADATDEDVAEILRDRLAAIERALGRLDEGTYGRSVRSGALIPDQRLEADPAAELTLAEAQAGPRG